MHTHNKTIQQVTVMAFTSMLLFCQYAVAEQGEPLSTQLGYKAEAQGTGAVAIGWGTNASGNGSIAIGSKKTMIGLDGTSATNGGIAIGQGSQSHVDGDVNFGSRRLSGLRDGVNDDEAATMRQINEVKAYFDSSSNQAIAIAQQYSDTIKNDVLAQGKQYSEALKNDALAQAKQYSDALKKDALAQGKQYMQQLVKAERAQQDQHLLSQARSYADRTNQTTLENAKEYSEEIGRSVLSNANAFTELRSERAEVNAVKRANQYTDQRFGQLQSQVRQFRRRAYAGVSGAMAMTALTPPPADANRSFGMAMATYRNQIALASGLSLRAGKNSNIRLNASWDSAGGLGAAAGFNLAW
ncbi:hypothetical protein CAP48_14485 [Advenella sp. S44]|uniref:YadA-like family protein n=1 Tax=Advenella sp. S44 TaxID=1982755 RepID=UPI000C2B298D|nr:YadA-like family protein [Advenella sp. S44]PJX22147.1 hypothetical protein CAP48_14485 [Advenella sp. S44]